MSRRNKHEEPVNAPDAADLAEGEILLGDQGAPPSVPATADDPAATLRREVEEWKDKYLRARAEMQNAARRAANEREDAVRYANAGVLRDLLDVVDDFERALAAADQTNSAVVEGLRLVQEKLAKFLRDHQVEPIEAQGAAFDPNQHEALLQQPSAEATPGTVLQQVQRGYRLRDRVLRPAKVIVATAVPGAGESGE